MQWISWTFKGLSKAYSYSQGCAVGSIWCNLYETPIAWQLDILEVILNFITNTIFVDHLMMLIVKSIIYIVKWHLLVGLVLEKVVVDNLLSEMLKLILPQYTFDRLLTIEVILYTFMVDKSQLNLTRLVEWFQRKHKIKTKKTQLQGIYHIFTFICHCYHKSFAILPCIYEMQESTCRCDAIQLQILITCLWACFVHSHK